jgi:putative flippase GtrA
MPSSGTRAIPRQLITYGAIGLIVSAIDFSTFNLALYRFHNPLYIATTEAYTVGVTSHFLLNRQFNFRNFERRFHEQATTYIGIVFAAWLFTLFIVTTAVHFGMAPFPARILAVILNFPVGFASHRYLTFGPGIIATLRRNAQGIRD